MSDVNLHNVLGLLEDVGKLIPGVQQATQIIPILERVTTLLTDAYQRYQAARETLSETDRAKLDAEYDQTKIKAQMDAMRVITELLWAESQPPSTNT